MVECDGIAALVPPDDDRVTAVCSAHSSWLQATSSVGPLDEGLRAAVAAARPPAKHVLLDADSVNFIDTTGCDALLDAIKELQSQGITFSFARVRDEVREPWTRVAGELNARFLTEPSIV